MGVKHLETYLHAHKNKYRFCMDVNIKELVEQYKVETGSNDVFLVVDGNCFQYEQYNFQKFDPFLGGELIEWSKHLDIFIKKFENIGAKLIFFFDGSIVKSKKKLWIARQQLSIGRQKKIFNWLMRNENSQARYYGSSEKKTTQTFAMPAMVGACGRYLLKYKLGCEVHVSVGDCDKEIAEFAAKNKCFAIMSQDTDYLILKGARYYLSMRYLDLDEMTTICYDGKEFASSLSLNQRQLPLLASLLGNDYISVRDLQPFHQRICGYESPAFIDAYTKVINVANYVRKQPYGRKLNKALPRIAKDVFDNSHLGTVLKTSIDSYLLDTTQITHSNCETLDLAFRKHVNCEIPPTLYPVLLGKPYELKAALEDFSSQLPPTANFFLPLRERMYGVLLHDNFSGNPPKVKVEEWCVTGEDLGRIPQRVRVIPIEDKSYPGLYKLWCNSPDIEPLRWKIFASAVSSSLSASKLQKLPIAYVVPAVTLHFILHKDRKLLLLEKYEVDAFISQAVLMYRRSIGDVTLEETAYKVPTLRMVHVSTLIGRGITTIILLMAACGFHLENVMPWLYYDGKLFQTQYTAAKMEYTVLNLLKNQENFVKDFEEIQNIAYSGVGTLNDLNISSSKIGPVPSNSSEKFEMQDPISAESPNALFKSKFREQVQGVDLSFMSKDSKVHKVEWSVNRGEVPVLGNEAGLLCDLKHGGTANIGNIPCVSSPEDKNANLKNGHMTSVTNDHTYLSSNVGKFRLLKAGDTGIFESENNNLSTSDDKTVDRNKNVRILQPEFVAFLKTLLSEKVGKWASNGINFDLNISETINLLESKVNKMVMNDLLEKSVRDSVSKTSGNQVEHGTNVDTWLSDIPHTCNGNSATCYIDSTSQTLSTGCIYSKTHCVE